MTQTNIKVPQMAASVVKKSASEVTLDGLGNEFSSIFNSIKSGVQTGVKTAVKAGTFILTFPF